MTSFTFTVPGKPQPKQRPRKGRGGHFYTPAATANYEALVGGHAAIARPRGWSKAAAYRVTVDAYLSSMRADVDNCAKSILDGCNGLVWRDDSQVAELVARKHIDREQPRAVVTIEIME